MDRYTAYSGAIPRTVEILGAQREAGIGIGEALRLVVGDAPVANGLNCTPTAPATMTVIVGPGSITALQPVEQSVWSALPADVGRATLKQGVNLDANLFGLVAPGVPGTTIAYLIEGCFYEADADPAVLSYRNAAAPANPLAGPSNSGAQQNTRRIQRAQLQLKAGVAAPAGTQVLPPTDAGWSPLWVITVNAGQTQITGADIARAPAAPFIDNKLGSLASAASLAGYATSGALAAETAARIAADGAEGVARNAQDAILLADIQAETAARIAQDAILLADIQAETAARLLVRPGYPNLVAFTAPGAASWVVPANIHIAKFTAIGGGGGGAGSPGTIGGGSKGGGGGGAGAWAIAYILVTPGDTIALNVGQGGGGGVPGAHAPNGTATTCGGFLTATGGIGGNNLENSAGGSGGSPYGQVLGYPGGDGGDGSQDNATGGGDGGGGLYGGGGRAGVGGGEPGRAAGAGGGGSYSSAGVGAYGAPGLIIVEF